MEDKFNQAIRTTQTEEGQIYVEAQLAINNTIHTYRQYYDMDIPEAIEAFKKFYFPLYVADVEKSEPTEVKERGAASLKIELSKGVITVTHGTDNVTLQQWTANAGDWDKLWSKIMELKNHATFNEGIKPSDIKLPKHYECPHLGCDDINGRTRAELKTHLSYWHSSSNEEIEQILASQ